MAVKPVSETYFFCSAISDEKELRKAFLRNGGVVMFLTMILHHGASLSSRQVSKSGSIISFCAYVSGRIVKMPGGFPTLICCVAFHLYTVGIWEGCCSCDEFSVL